MSVALSIKLTTYVGSLVYQRIVVDGPKFTSVNMLKTVSCANLRPMPSAIHGETAQMHWRWANWGIAKDWDVLILNVESLTLENPNIVKFHFTVECTEVPDRMLMWLVGQGCTLEIEAKAVLSGATTESGIAIGPGDAKTTHILVTELKGTMDGLGTSLTQKNEAAAAMKSWEQVKKSIAPVWPSPPATSYSAYKPKKITPHKPDGWRDEVDWDVS